MGSEKFSLKWNDFQTNVSNCFVQLRNETKLLDVTLVGNDHQQVSAHKLVLSACSEVFQEIFNHNTSSNLVLYLESVDSKEINLLLNYIYQGEVQIFQEYLDRFLEIAEKFKLNGLLTDNENSHVQDSIKVQEEEESNFIQDRNTYLSHKMSRPPKTNVSETKIVLPSKQFVDSSNSEVETKFSELIVKEDNMYQCTVCDRRMQGRTFMSRHLETHLSGLSYECPMCGSFRSTNSLIKHETVYHRSKPK